MVVEGWLGRAVAARPHHAAIETPSGSWSYSQLLAAAQSGADELLARGAGRGTRVAIALEPGLGFAQALPARLLPRARAGRGDVRAAAAGRHRIAAGAAVLVEATLASAPPAGGRRRGSPAGRKHGHELDATARVLHPPRTP